MFIKLPVLQFQKKEANKKRVAVLRINPDYIVAYEDARIEDLERWKEMGWDGDIISGLSVVIIKDIRTGVNSSSLAVNLSSNEIDDLLGVRYPPKPLYTNYGLADLDLLNEY